jgi:hypothetical protein
MTDQGVQPYNHINIYYPTVSPLDNLDKMYCYPLTYVPLKDALQSFSWYLGTWPYLEIVYLYTSSS